MYIGIKLPEHHLHHVTLAFLCKSEYDSLEQYKRAAAAVSAAALAYPHSSIYMEFGGTDKFEEGPWYGSIDSFELEYFREKLVECMQYYAVDFANDHEYTPHVTLSYWPKEPTNPYAGQEMAITKITLFSNEYGQTDFWI